MKMAGIFDRNCDDSIYTLKLLFIINSYYKSLDQKNYFDNFIDFYMNQLQFKFIVESKNKKNIAIEQSLITNFGIYINIKKKI